LLVRDEARPAEPVAEKNCPLTKLRKSLKKKA